MFLKRGCWNSAGQAGVPVQRWIGETRASVGDLCPTSSPCHARSASATWEPCAWSPVRV